MRATVVGLLLASFLAGCGGAASDADTPSPARIEVYEVRALPVEAGGNEGWTDWSDPETTRIYVLETVSHEVTNVLIHELLHAMGLREHESDPACYLYAGGVGDHLGGPLCESEARRLAAVAHPATIYVRTETVRTSVEGAAAFLNAKVGWDALTVVGP